MKYPLEKKSDWHLDQNYKETGAEMVHMSPKKFLKNVRPMIMDKRDHAEIERHLKSFGKGDGWEPLSMRNDGTEDGRHRALTSWIKGVDKVPVLRWKDRKDVKETDKGVMKQIKKVVKKYRDNEKYK